MRVGNRLRGLAVFWLVTATAQAQSVTPEPQIDGLERLLQQLSAPTEPPRISAYREIGFRNDRQGYALLASHLERPNLALSPLAQLTIARILAPRATTPAVYRMLLYHAFAIANDFSPAEPLQRLALETSLLGVAKQGTEQSLTDLGRALATTGILAETATTALLVYPPAPVTRLLQPSVKRSPALLRLLGKLRATPAIDFLHQQLLEAPQELQLAAAAALMELNDPEIPPLLKRWATAPDTPAEFQELARAHATNDKTVALGDYRPVSLDHDELTTALLLHYASRPTHLPTVESLTGMLSSPKAVNRFLAAALLSSVRPVQLLPFVRSEDGVIRRAIEWALPYLPPDSPLTTAVLLQQSWGCLVHPQLQDRMPTAFLLDLAHSSSPHAPLGAEALAARLCPVLTAEVRLFLNSTDPLLRAATAQGLGRATLPAATGLLLTHYNIEAEPLVRRAIVLALQMRQSRLGRGLLNDVAAFDPDRIARQLAGNADRSRLVPEGFFDPFQRTIVGRLTGPSSSAPIAYRRRHPGAETSVRILGPLGRSVVVPLDPRGLLLIPGDPRSLTLNPNRPAPPVPVAEPQD